MSAVAPSPLTYFASPERQSPEGLAQQAAQFEDMGALARVLDLIPSLVMILNRQRQLLFGNRALREFTRPRQNAGLVGLRPGELLACHHAAGAPNGCGTSEACRTCGAANAILAGLQGNHSRHECRVRTTEHEALDLRVEASPFRWLDNDYVLVIATDIGDLKRRQVLERLFFHDILNTAGGIQGLAEIIDMNPGEAAQLSGDLRQVAETLVNEIRMQRMLVAAENQDLALSPTGLKAAVILEQVASVYRHHRIASGVLVKVEGAGADFDFISDESILQRILGNLLKNAMEASRPGETVSIGAALVANEVVFWCHNPGCMPREVQLQIFQRSYTSKGVGRGIGTYSVKLLTERYLGGRAMFTSAPEVGTRFEVRLPLALPGGG